MGFGFRVTSLIGAYIMKAHRLIVYTISKQDRRGRCRIYFESSPQMCFTLLRCPGTITERN